MALPTPCSPIYALLSVCSISVECAWQPSENLGWHHFKQIYGTQTWQGE